MAKPNRDSQNNIQERISRDQLLECIHRQGWTAAELPDLGEDFIFSVYFDLVAQGVAFYVQLKSVTNYAHRARGDYLPYSFDVIDLKHWEGFALPVVLVVWDTGLREGRWLLVGEAVTNLDSHTPNWRQHKTATVRLPLDHGTDQRGMDLMRIEIGHHLYPIISKGRESEVHFEVSYDNTPEGQQRFADFERCIKNGERVEISGDNIKELRFSDWLQPWIIPHDRSQMRLVLGPRNPPSRQPVSVEITTNQGITSAIPYLELELSSPGIDMLNLSNRTLYSPVILELHLDRLNQQSLVSLSCSPGFYGSDMNETLRILNFCENMANGGVLSIEFLSAPGHPMLFDLPPDQGCKQDPEYIRLVHLLWDIQRKTRTVLRIPSVGLTEVDYQVLNELNNINQIGKSVSNAEEDVLTQGFTDMEPVLPHLTLGAPVEFTEIDPKSFIEIFGVQVPLGPRMTKITAKLGMANEEIQDFIASNPGQPIPLRLLDVEYTDTYTNWLK